MKLTLANLGISRVQAVELIDHLELIAEALHSSILEKEIEPSCLDSLRASLVTTPAQLNWISAKLKSFRP